MASKYFKLEPSGGGRPRMVLNEQGKQLIEALAKIMCTDEEIAACLDTTPKTLLNANNRQAYYECYKKGRENGKASLRRTQFKLAEKSAAMAIFLGKNYLGQTDATDVQKLEISTNEQNSLVLALRNVAKGIDKADSDIPEMAEDEPEIDNERDEQ